MSDEAQHHPLGVGWGPEQQSCATCCWSKLAGPGPKVLRCVASGNKRVRGHWKACQFWEAALDCLDCAACCGPAFDAVEVSPGDPVRKKHPHLIARYDGRFHVPRTPDNHCVNLDSQNKCVIYDDRPRCCREFERGSANCIFARRRVELSQTWRTLTP